MNSKTLNKYRTKAKDSFKTKKNLFIFNWVINDKGKFTYTDFENFQITDELVSKYAAEYWQQEYSYDRIKGMTIKEIQESIVRLEEENKELLQELEKKYIEKFPKIFSKKDFEELLKNEECYYCGITIDKLERLADKKKLFNKTNRGWSLEIDRKKPNYEYSKDNCVMACYWCNNAKTDEFNDEEFKVIGKEIAKIWEKRLEE